MSEELNTLEETADTIDIQSPEGMSHPSDEAIIDQIVAEAEAMESGEEKPAKPAKEKKEAAPAPKSEPKAAKETEKDDGASEGKQDLVSTQLAQIHRHKTRAEKALAKKEAEIDAKLRALENSETKTVADLKAMARKNPIKFFQEELGIEKTSEIGRMLYAPELGDQAPEDLKRLAGQWELQQELQSVRQELSEFKTTAEKEKAEERDRQLMDNSRGYLKSYLNELPDTVPYLQRLAKARPDQAADALLESAVRYAQENPNSEPLSVEELVEKYNAALAEELSFLDLSFEKKAETPAPKKKASKTLSNRLTSPTHASSEPESEEDMILDIAKALEEGRTEF